MKLSELLVNCGGKGGKPGRCPTSAATTKSVRSVAKNAALAATTHADAKGTSKAHEAAAKAHNDAAAVMKPNSSAQTEHRMSASIHLSKAKNGGVAPKGFA